MKKDTTKEQFKTVIEDIRSLKYYYGENLYQGDSSPANTIWHVCESWNFPYGRVVVRPHENGDRWWCTSCGYLASEAVSLAISLKNRM